MLRKAAIATLLLLLTLGGLAPAWGTITVVNSATAVVNKGKIIINAPASSQAGDLLIAHISWQLSYSVNNPSGWTQIGSDNTNGDILSRVLYRYWQSGETAYTWTITGGYGAGGIIGLRGCASSSPAGTNSANGASSGTTATATGITVSNNSMVLAFFGCYNSTAQNFSTVSGWTEQWDRQDSRTSNACDYLLYATGGPTGDQTSTISGTNSGWSARLVEVLAAPSNQTYENTLTVSATPTFGLTGVFSALPTASFAGTSTLAPVGVFNTFLSASLPGTSAYTTTGGMLCLGAASFAGTAGYSGGGLLNGAPVLSLSGASAFTPGALANYYNSLGLVGTSGYVSAVLNQAVGSLSLNGASSYMTAGYKSMLSSLGFPGASTFAAAGYFDTFITLSLAGTSALSQAGNLSALPSLALNGISGFATGLAGMVYDAALNLVAASGLWQNIQLQLRAAMNSSVVSGLGANALASLQGTMIVAAQSSYSLLGNLTIEAAAQFVVNAAISVIEAVWHVVTGFYRLLVPAELRRLVMDLENRTLVELQEMRGLAVEQETRILQPAPENRTLTLR